MHHRLPRPVATVITAVLMMLGIGLSATACGSSTPQPPQPMWLTGYNGYTGYACVAAVDPTLECGPGSVAYAKYGSLYGPHYVLATQPTAFNMYGTDPTDEIWVYFLAQRSYYDSGWYESHYISHTHVVTVTVYKSRWSGYDKSYGSTYKTLPKTYVKPANPAPAKVNAPAPAMPSTARSAAPSLKSNGLTNTCPAQGLDYAMGSSKPSAPKKPSIAPSRPSVPSAPQTHRPSGC